MVGGEHFNTWLTAESCISSGIISSVVVVVVVVEFLLALNNDVVPSAVSVAAHLAGKNFL